MWWHKDQLWLDRLKINHLNTQTMHVCNTKIKQKVINLSFHCYCNTQHIFCNFYLSHSFNLAVLIYKVSATKGQSSASFDTFLCSNCHIFATYKPMLFFMPQYLERQSNQPQKRGGKSDTTEAHTFQTKNAHMLHILCLLRTRLTNDEASKVIITYNF